MSDYTPTTEEVGRGYCLSRNAPGDISTAEFDRWLAAERARVWDEAVEACNRYGGIDMYEDEFRARCPYRKETP